MQKWNNVEELRQPYNQIFDKGWLFGHMEITFKWPLRKISDSM